MTQKESPINLKEFCEALGLVFKGFKGSDAVFRKDDKTYKFPSRIFRHGNKPKAQVLFYGFDTIREFMEFQSSILKRNAYKGLDSRSFQDGFMSALVKMHGSCPSCHKKGVKDESVTARQEVEG